MKTRVVVLGAGFGGLELTTILSDAFGDAIDIVLIDKDDAFVFGFSKLDVMFRRKVPADVRHPYRDIVKPGVRFLQSTVRSIDPVARRVVTDAGTFEAEALVVALGADIAPASTPGLMEGATSSTRLREPSHCATRSRASSRARPSLACQGSRSNVLPHQAKRRCCCTITSPPAGAARPPRSRW